MLIRTNLIPRGFDALTAWPFILIRPEAAQSAGLLAHEQVHYEEQRRAFVVPWWGAYLLSKSFRQNAEVRAYRRQIAVGGITAWEAAQVLTTYRLNITHAQALELLTAAR